MSWNQSNFVHYCTPKDTVPRKLQPDSGDTNGRGRIMIKYIVTLRYSVCITNPKQTSLCVILIKEDVFEIPRQPR